MLRVHPLPLRQIIRVRRLVKPFVSCVGRHGHVLNFTRCDNAEPDSDEPNGEAQNDVQESVEEIFPFKKPGSLILEG